MAYFHRVEQALKGEEHAELYTQFLQVMADMKKQKEATPSIVARIRVIFKGHPELFGGFNAFLPKGKRIDFSVTPEAATPASTTTSKSSTATPATAFSKEGGVSVASVDLSHLTPPARRPHWTPTRRSSQSTGSSLNHSPGRTPNRSPTLGPATATTAPPTLESLAALSPESSPGGSPTVTLTAATLGRPPDASFNSSIQSESFAGSPSLHSRVSLAVAEWEETHSRQAAMKNLRRRSSKEAALEELQKLLADQKGKHTQEKLRLEETISTLKEENWVLRNEKKAEIER